MTYKTYTSDTVTYEYPDGVLINVDIVVQCPDGIVADERVLNDAVERAVDYIMDEGLNDE